MKTTSTISPVTRIYPVKNNKVNLVTKEADGSLDLEFSSGLKGNLTDKDLQAFAIWTMINPGASRES